MVISFYIPAERSTLCETRFSKMKKQPGGRYTAGVPLHETRFYKMKKQPGSRYTAGVPLCENRLSKMKNQPGGRYTAGVPLHKTRFLVYKNGFLQWQSARWAAAKAWFLPAR